MATVHPSRMGLVPQGNGDYSHRSHYHSRSRTPEPKRNRSRSNSPGREGERGRDHGGRRHSPEYDEYSKETNPAPWHSQSNMYPERREGRGRRDNYYQTGSSDWFTHRQQLRDNGRISIWPPSPKAPERSLSRSRSRSPRRKRHKKRSRRHDKSVTPSSETDSSEEERRRKEKRAHKRREKEEQRESKRRRHHERRERTRSKSVEEQSRQRRGRTKTRSPSPEPDDGDGEWVEKPAANTLTSLMAPSTITQPAIKNGTAAAVAQNDDESDTELGPQPAFKTSAKVDERAYGGSLLRGEGSAMAAFLAEDTNARIPRRGEIGLASDQIASFEAAGYVMSGSRHRRMNAVRLRKENQVISAEEKRGILKLQKEERGRREELLREEFKELMQDKLKVAGTKQPQPQ